MYSPHNIKHEWQSKGKKQTKKNKQKHLNIKHHKLGYYWRKHDAPMIKLNFWVLNSMITQVINYLVCDKSDIHICQCSQSASCWQHLKLAHRYRQVGQRRVLFNFGWRHMIINLVKSFSPISVVSRISNNQTVPKTAPKALLTSDGLQAMLSKHKLLTESPTCTQGLFQAVPRSALLCAFNIWWSSAHCQCSQSTSWQNLQHAKRHIYFKLFQ